jgi:hypothetical protein
MGSTYIAGIVDQLGDGDLALQQAVSIQLKANHFPPVHSDWVDVAIKAIKTVEGDLEGDLGWDDLEIPVSQRKGSKTHITVSEVMDGLHLWDLVRETTDDVCDECESIHENDIVTKDA